MRDSKSRFAGISHDGRTTAPTNELARGAGVALGLVESDPEVLPWVLEGQHALEERKQAERSWAPLARRACEKRNEAARRGLFANGNSKMMGYPC